LAAPEKLRKVLVVNLAEASASPRAASTRDLIMAHIMEHGQGTAAELSAKLHLTQAGVRRHLTALEEQGLVTLRVRKSYTPRSPGRPAKVYEPTGQGRRQFGHAYDELAIAALDYLRQAAGEDAVAGFATYRFAALEQAYRRLRAAQPAASPAEALRNVLNAHGFMADLAPVQSGEQLRQHHCPYSAVAERFPELCQAETQAFARLLASHVQRLATIAHGDGVCTTHIPFPRPPQNQKPQNQKKSKEKA
jgi:predicted ArsR family transcriptional regulator